jgi:hypothetical protein
MKSSVNGNLGLKIIKQQKQMGYLLDLMKKQKENAG